MWRTRSVFSRITNSFRVVASMPISAHTFLGSAMSRALKSGSVQGPGHQSGAVGRRLGLGELRLLPDVLLGHHALLDEEIAHGVRALGPVAQLVPGAGFMFFARTVLVCHRSSP